MKFSETTCEVFRADDTTNLLAHIWLPEKVKAVFLAIHGGLAHAGDWVTPALHFMKNNIATYALDLRWHGTYPQFNKKGKVFFHINSYDEYSRDINNFYQWIRSRHPSLPIFILSHSNGALIALNYGLTIGKDADISGFIVSSPWLKNKVVVPKILHAMMGVIAAIHPTFSAVPESLTDKLTHDPVITARHHADETAGLRGLKASVKLGVESEKTQEWVLDNIQNWKKFPLFAVIAGQDYLADPKVSEDALNKVPKNLLTLYKYINNYHENFNELNRKEIYGNIWKWMKKLM